MKGLVVIGAVVTLTAVAPDLWASPVTRSPQVSAGQQGLLLEGPVESINAKNGTVVVLGQKLSIKLPEGVTVGDQVSVYGKMRDDGTLTISELTSQGVYVPGASHVVLTAVVQQVRASIGRAKIGGVDVDLTSVSAADGATSVVSGTVVQISGTQPSSHGVVLADALVGGGVSSNAIVGGGVNANAIVGGGINANAIVGGGGAKPNAIVGGGVSAKAIVGGGTKANAIVGGGISANAIVGGGGAKPNAIVGGGVSAKAIVGGGISANAIVGGGINSNAIVGGGR